MLIPIGDYVELDEEQDRELMEGGIPFIYERPRALRGTLQESHLSAFKERIGKWGEPDVDRVLTKVLCEEVGLLPAEALEGAYTAERHGAYVELPTVTQRGLPYYRFALVYTVTFDREVSRRILWKRTVLKPVTADHILGGAARVGPGITADIPTSARVLVDLVGLHR